MDRYLNYFCRKWRYMGKTILQLFSKNGCEWGEENKLYSLYMESLVESGVPLHTRLTYGRPVSHFIDYMKIADNANGTHLSEVKRAYLSYHSYLTLGDRASESLAKLAASLKPRPLVEIGTSWLYHAAIDDFIKFCKALVDEERNYKDQGEAFEIPSRDFVIALTRSVVVGQRRKISAYNSGLGIKKVASNRVSNHLGRVDRVKKLIEPNKFFPLDAGVELIDSACSWRNGALWAMLAATSVRPSEALQILWDDIDFDRREINIYNPFERPNFSSSYRGLSQHDMDRLKWKGRTTCHTFILEPYGEMFFECLERYRDSGDGSSHNFVFQTMQGRPLFLSDYGKVILAPFKVAATPIYRKRELSLHKIGLHSLRHSYCYYMRNFVEHRGSYGLTPHELIMLTGHADANSVQVYAKVDKEALFEQLGVANIKRFGHIVGTDAEMHVIYLEQRILDWKAKVREEQKNK